MTTLISQQIQIKEENREFLFSNQTIYYTVNIPASKEEFTNKFYFAFETTPTSRELIREIRNHINKLANSYTKSERFRTRIPKIKANLDKITTNNLEQFLEEWRTYRLDIDDELYMTINRFNLRHIIL